MKHLYVLFILLEIERLKRLKYEKNRPMKNN
ncbi:Hypothetical Protein SLY_0081 [Strawberry lethal yellows phytoplasma (CPA) str. NZSb11]|uniref:Uncharacterized protein n=1 Tax=Strawberry lethal yellows phytoplasma (CPA) str. NZSb11 TaxID=980422 RepID=R4RVZ3_PHYAS|nr:Hypothetical Protein SLY_0081 [Strawberry lethal yellows phytoplasma (CPA) str. NZSb11]